MEQGKEQWRMDRGRLARMRQLGVRWKLGDAVPTYPSTMTELQTREADALYDSLGEDFISYQMGQTQQ